MTTLTLDLPAKVANALRREAAAEAKEVEQFVCELLEGRLAQRQRERSLVKALAGIRTAPAEGEEDVEQSLLSVVRVFLRKEAEKAAETFVREDVEWGLRGED